jgi:hypothetical protein
MAVTVPITLTIFSGKLNNQPRGSGRDNISKNNYNNQK